MSVVVGEVSVVVGRVWCVLAKDGDERVDPGLYGVFATEALAEAHVATLSVSEAFEVEMSEVLSGPMFEGKDA